MPWLLVVSCPDPILNLSWGLLRFASLEWKMFLSPGRFWGIQDLHVRCSSHPHHSENCKGFRSSVLGTGQQPNISIFCHSITKQKQEQAQKKHSMCCKQNLCYQGSQDWPALYFCLGDNLSVSSAVCSFLERMQSCLPGWAHGAALRSAVKCSEVVGDDRKSQKLSAVSSASSNPLFL